MGTDALSQTGGRQAMRGASIRVAERPHRHFKVLRAQSLHRDPAEEGTLGALQPLGEQGREAWADTRLEGGAEWVGAGSWP